VIIRGYPDSRAFWEYLSIRFVNLQVRITILSKIQLRFIIKKFR